MDTGIKMSEIIYIQENNKKRKATVEEIAQFQKDVADEAERKRLFEAEQQAKANAKQSAMNKLKALGLTDNEIEGLMG